MKTRIQLAIASLIYLTIGCKSDSNYEAKNMLTKSLVSTYIKSIDSQGMIQISQSSYGPVNRDCLTEILNKYKFEIPFEETFQAQETDTIAWSKEFFSNDSVKILSSRERSSISRDIAPFDGETLDKTFYVISKPIFSKDQNFAILKKYFFCGGRCGQGSVLVYKKKGNGWVLQEDICPIVS
ncbi:hypothetical protein N180_03105 [Pedobacter antarcticus 4BY]|uniref:Lipoprotein n=2 Tax=Pedobacter antarcticus TaxID=34086 RepID=A0A081PKM6_9SPHI|nr:hypothetical protein [Pedobacter antarcticus]KEQ31249.1 hypothetical protein N180_03105 [Pedobacter antarcticus 4BY]